MCYYVAQSMDFGSRSIGSGLTVDRFLLRIALGGFNQFAHSLYSLSIPILDGLGLGKGMS